MRNVTILLAVVAMLAATAGAAETLYEGFEYTGNLDGQNGGTGFDGAWSVTTLGDPASFLSTPGLDCDGNPYAATATRMDDQLEGLIAKRKLNTTNAIDLDSDGTHYLSMMIKGTSTLRISFGDEARDNYFDFGLSDDYLSEDGYRLYCALGSYRYEVVTQGTTYFIVAKIETSAAGSDVMSMNIYDTAVPPTEEPATWDIVSDDTLSGNFNYLHLLTVDRSAEDEIRMGETWGDVAVPEPATMCLLGIGGIGVLIRRRRK